MRQIILAVCIVSFLATPLHAQDFIIGSGSAFHIDGATLELHGNWINEGTYRYNFVGDLWSGDVVLRDIDMTAMFFPTTGVGAPKVAPVEETPVDMVDTTSDSIGMP